MKVLITAGGTTERIDDVRGINNFSTGRLGSLLADAFAKRTDVEVIYLYGDHALLPDNPNIRLVSIESTRDLANSLEEILLNEEIAAVIHSMAVSDYYSSGVVSGEALEDFFQQPAASKTKFNFWQLFTKERRRGTKISSASEDLFVKLSKNPKVIAKIKAWSPKTKLVGFKLLVGVTEEELVSVASQTLLKNNCDFVLANDKNTISGDQHQGLLINQSGIIDRYQNKQEIAQGILEHVMKEIL